MGKFSYRSTTEQKNSSAIRRCLFNASKKVMLHLIPAPYSSEGGPQIPLFLPNKSPSVSLGLKNIIEYRYMRSNIWERVDTAATHFKIPRKRQRKQKGMKEEKVIHQISNVERGTETCSDTLPHIQRVLQALGPMYGPTSAALVSSHLVPSLSHRYPAKSLDSLTKTNLVSAGHVP